MCITGLSLLVTTACSTARSPATAPLFIPSTALVSCLPQPLNPDEHFADMDAVTRHIGRVGIDTAGLLVQCEAKRQALVTVIKKGQENGKGGE